MNDLPASSVSATLSWGVYLASSLLLFGGLSPYLTALGDGARFTSLAGAADGLAAALSGLRPGMTLTISLQPNGEATVQMGGHFLALKGGNASIVRSCVWELPSTSLEPGGTYRFTLSGDTVGVEPVG